jgi:CTP synthase (UTP-ammonia lyase)
MVTRPIQIALIGDYDVTIDAHQAIPLALELAREATGTRFDAHWLRTDTIRNAARLAAFDAFWCVPGSPYRSMDGALTAIRHARESGRPFLGTCGGFQHAVIEYARHVLGWADADHAETAPDAARTVISELRCALVEATETVRCLPGTHLARAYGAERATETYGCRYGLDPRFRDELLSAGLRPAALSEAGEVRGVELEGHPFFVAVLFQPERAALAGRTPPLIAEFLRACATR